MISERLEQIGNSLSVANYSLIKEFLNKGCDPNTELTISIIKSNGKEASMTKKMLTWAAFYGDLETMKILLKRGADIDGDDVMGSPLYMALVRSQPAAVRLLLENGANFNREIQDMFKYNLLTFCCLSGEVECGKILYEFGADKSEIISLIKNSNEYLDEDNEMKENLINTFKTIVLSSPEEIPLTKF